jgi:ATP-binding protein involved in chromosome partitioning
MVTTPQQVAVADAVKAMNMFRMENINVPILGVIENMAWFTPAELPDNKYYLFGKGGGDKLAEAGNTSVLARIPLVQSVGEGGDQGSPAILSDTPMKGLLSSMAESVVASVQERNKRFAPTEVVKMQ